MKSLKKPTIAFLFIPIIAYIGTRIITPFVLGEIIISFLPQLVFAHILFLLLLSPLLYLNRKQLFVFSLLISNIVMILMNLGTIKSEYYFHTDDFDNGTKLLSLNLYYYNNQLEELEYIFQKQDSDILVLLEFSNKHYDYLQDYLIKNYPYTSIDSNIEGRNVVFSKHPIISSEYIDLSTNFPGFLYNEIVIDDKIYDLYAVHTAAPINQLYFENRNIYLSELSEHINSKDREYILAGDFNVTPWSTYFRDFLNTIEKNPENASSSKGFTTTWDMLGLRISSTHIDHIFISENIRYNLNYILDVPGSDHRAIVFEFK